MLWLVIRRILNVHLHVKRVRNSNFSLDLNRFWLCMRVLRITDAIYCFMFWLILVYFVVKFISFAWIFTLELKFLVEVVIDVLEVQFGIFSDCFCVLNWLNRNDIVSFWLLFIDISVRNLFRKRRQRVSPVIWQFVER